MSALLPAGTADGGVKTVHGPSGCRYVSSYGNHSKINGCHESSRNKSPGEHSEEVKTSPSGIPPSPEKHPSSLPVCFLTKHLLNTDWNQHSFVVHVCKCEAGNNPDLVGSPMETLAMSSACFHISCSFSLTFCDAIGPMDHWWPQGIIYLFPA